MSMYGHFICWLATLQNRTTACWQIKGKNHTEAAGYLQIFEFTQAWAELQGTQDTSFAKQFNVFLPQS